MEEFYQVHNDGNADKYIIIGKKHPGFMAYIEDKGDHLEISRLNLLENCEVSVLAKALSEMEVYLNSEQLNKEVSGK